MIARLAVVIPLICGLVSIGRLSGFKVDQIDHLVLSVTNISRAREFYIRVLGMEGESDWGPTSVYFGTSKINLHEHGRGFEPKAGFPTPGSADLCFVTETDIDQVIRELEKNNVTVLLGPVWRPGARGSITSVYFRDPDDNLIEIANY